MARPVKNRSLNATAAIMSHDDDVADVEVHHTIRDDCLDIKVAVPVLVRDVAFCEKSTGSGSKDSSLRNPRVAV